MTPPTARALAPLCGWLLGCPAAAGPTPGPLDARDLVVVAEGPCARLSMQDAGGRRFLVFGDTGYDLELWVAGERLAEAQSLVELKEGTAFHAEELLAGLPRDARGYVPGRIDLGGDFTRRAWLRVTTTRYAPHGTGKLFERESAAFGFSGHWEPLADSIGAELPEGLGSLPALPLDRTCPEERTFLPLAHDVAPDGGVFVAGRCQGSGITPHPDTTLWVLHGGPGETSWTPRRASSRPALEGHMNVDLFARSSSEVYLAAYEPFQPVEGRTEHVVRWDGASWSELPLGLDAGVMSVAGTPDGALWLATGSGVHRRSPSGAMTTLSLPAPRFVAPGARLHVHTVRAAGSEVWVESSLKVRRPAQEGAATEEVWASALFGPRGYGALHCDAREPADAAVTELD